MKVILKQTLPKVGKEGTVVNVKDGFARNFLFPQGLAIYADRTQIKALETRMARLAGKMADTKADAEVQAAKLKGQRVVIAAKSGEANKLFGAITNADIAVAIKEQYGVEVDKRSVAMLSAIKRVGQTRIDVDLHRQVDCHMFVIVYDPEKGMPEELQPQVEEVEEVVEAVAADDEE